MFKRWGAPATAAAALWSLCMLAQAHAPHLGSTPPIYASSDDSMGLEKWYGFEDAYWEDLHQKYPATSLVSDSEGQESVTYRYLESEQSGYDDNCGDPACPCHEPLLEDQDKPAAEVNVGQDEPAAQYQGEHLEPGTAEYWDEYGPCSHVDGEYGLDSPVDAAAVERPVVLETFDLEEVDQLVSAGQELADLLNRPSTQPPEAPLVGIIYSIGDLATHHLVKSAGRLVAEQSSATGEKLKDGLHGLGRDGWLNQASEDREGVAHEDASAGRGFHMFYPGYDWSCYYPADDVEVVADGSVAWGGVHWPGSMPINLPIHGAAWIGYRACSVVLWTGKLAEWSGTWIRQTSGPADRSPARARGRF